MMSDDQKLRFDVINDRHTTVMEGPVDVKFYDNRAHMTLAEYDRLVADARKLANIQLHIAEWARRKAAAAARAPIGTEKMRARDCAVAAEAAEIAGVLNA